MAETMDLTGKLLVAMPGMGDTRFARAVIFMCAHSEDGAMGLIVNKPAPAVTMGDVVDAGEITLPPDLSGAPVYFGGPVETGRGFVLHSDDYLSDLQTLEVCQGFAMTATADIFEDMAAGRGPAQGLLMLGYSGWGPGQLEGEIARNGWLTMDADVALVFGTDNRKKWQAALNGMGIDPLGLSSSAGRA